MTTMAIDMVQVQKMTLNHLDGDPMDVNVAAVSNGDDKDIHNIYRHVVSI